MAKSLTLRTDDKTFEELEALAERSSRSKNYIANEALKKYVGSNEGARPVVTSPEDLAGDFWPEDDSDDFLAFLKSERDESRNEPEREL